MTDNTTPMPTARVKPASNWSAVWILPIIALMIGGWLAWKAYSEAGVMIEIQFEKGDGLVAGKTELYYKGIALGKVKDVTLDQKTGQVHVQVEVDRTAKDYLREKTIFWLVTPQVTLAGVTGLDTLLSGNYIAMYPGDGEEIHKFVALNEPPPLADGLPGLHLKLRAENLGSLSEGSPVYYRQIKVGSVTGYSFDNEDLSVLVKVHIAPEYAHLVRNESRFWNASGVSVSASLAGVTVDVESLLSLAVGGIAFETPAQSLDSLPMDSQSRVFPLYKDYKAAQAGIVIKVFLPTFNGLEPEKTKLRWNGFPIGVVRTGIVSPDLKGMLVEIDVNPRAQPWLTEDAQFWLVEPELSLNGISGLDAILSGNYIEFKPGSRDKLARRDFKGLSSAPPINFDTPGLHLLLSTEQAASLKAGSPVLFRQLVVGSISNVSLAPNRQQVRVAVHIEPQYSQLVNSSSRFWNASGITLSGGLSGIQVHSESLSSLLNGGIAFETPQAKAAAVHNGSHFILHANQDSAVRKAEQLELEVSDANGLSAGTPVRYRGFQVGKVSGVELSPDLKSLRLQLMITDAATRIARQGTVFNVVRPELGLIHSANLETLITGPYIDVQPASNPAAARQTRFKSEALAKIEVDQKVGLQIGLTTPQRKSLKVGIPLTYRGIAVGQVTDMELSPDAASVLVHVLVLPDFGKLVHRGSKFWNESGVNVDFSLFKGATIRTDSVASLLEGSIAFATPDDASKGPPARNGTIFDLHDEVQEAWLKWRPRIAIGQNR